MWAEPPPNASWAQGPAFATKPVDYDEGLAESDARVTYVLRHLAPVVLACVLLAACESDAPRTVAAPAASSPPPAASNAPAAEQFAAVRTGSGGQALVYGTYTRGCISGAEQLPTDGPNWQVLNPSRNRAWGHPNLVRFVRALAAGVAADGYRGLIIGDLGQPRGGPSPSDHNSHQIGLDVDVWLTPMFARKLSAGELESYEPPSMVDYASLSIRPQLFGAAQMAMLKRAAMSPEVERIFVSPPIKRALCNRTPADQRWWLHKVRPWRGHTSHMHVRIGCPPGSTECKPQDPPPDGDGCGAELQSWFKDRRWTHEGTKRYEPEHGIRVEQLPAQCRTLLTRRG